ncbi:MAG: hypothetical protein HYX56_05560 [Chloroflexi bacterium]|nr:hypothetical protein [Chloroflexota bacterium]
MDGIVEIGAVRLVPSADGELAPGDRFVTLVDPGQSLGSAVARLTGIANADLVGAPTPAAVIEALRRFLGQEATLVGHNVGFDAGFLENAGLGRLPRLDTAELASILLPGAPSYALQRLAADEAIVPEAAHRALHDALTCASVLTALAHRARSLPPLILEECRGQAELLGLAYVAFFERALSAALKTTWMEAQPSSARPGDVAGEPGSRMRQRGEQTERAEGGQGRGSPERRAGETPAPPAGASPGRALLSFRRLEGSMPGYEERPEQIELATAIERTFETGGVLVAEAGTGIGKSLAYLVPALARAEMGERVIVSTHTLPLQDQLVRKDLPALQDALGTDVPVAVLKGRSNYLCPRRWQAFRTSAATREEARLALKTLVWRTTTETGDRAELNLMGGEGALWSRISSDDETCDGRRCARVPGGCYLQRARERAANAGILVVNHALLLYDARLRSALMPEADHAVVDEAHHLEDVASDVFGYRLEDVRLRRDLDRVGRSALVIAALKDERVDRAELLRDAIAKARERAEETFGTLAALVPAESGEDRLRITGALRASDDRWLPVELAAERLADALAEVVSTGERLTASAALEEEDLKDELAAATVEIVGTRIAIARGIHDPRGGDIVWIARQSDGTPGLYVAPGHVGATLRRALVDRFRSVVMTSATLAVAGSLSFTLERFGLSDVAGTLVLGSSFDHAQRSVVVVPTDVAYPRDVEFASDVASTVTEVARVLCGRTLVLFTSHSAMREVSALLEPLEDEGIAVLTQGLGGSRRAIVDRFKAGGAVLLGTQSFWEGVDLPGELLRCVVIAKLPFAVPDDPLVAGRSERYDDPFREFLLPQAALRLRQGYGRLLRTRTDRGAVVLMDKRVVEREYGATFIASLPDVRVRRVPREEVAAIVAEAARD